MQPITLHKHDIQANGLCASQSSRWMTIRHLCIITEKGPTCVHSELVWLCAAVTGSLVLQCPAGGKTLGPRPSVVWAANISDAALDKVSPPVLDVSPTGISSSPSYRFCSIPPLHSSDLCVDHRYGTVSLWCITQMGAAQNQRPLLSSMLLIGSACALSLARC